MNRTDRPDFAEERDALFAAARNLYRERRMRDEAFDGARIFGEPAWDLLLDLYVASHERKKVSVTSACVASSVPVTTALRWLGHLETQGLVIRSADSNDRRRMLVALTPKAIETMESYLRQIVACGSA